MKRGFLADACVFVGIATLTFGLAIIAHPRRSIVSPAMSVPSKPTDAGDDIPALQAKLKELRGKYKANPDDPQLRGEIEALTNKVRKLYSDMFDEAKAK